jgi:hypothetical protein
MRTRFLLLALFLGLGFGSLVAVPTPAAEKADAKKIDKLIEQLGSSDFKEREQATKALDAIGEPALEALKKAAKGDDIEVRKRAATLVANIEKRTQSTRLLAPTRVHLKYKETPIKDAVADFKKKTGYDIALHDPDNKLKDRKITLDTGDVTFWEAFDKFCKAASLRQATIQDVLVQPPQPGGPGVRPGGKGIRPLPPDKAPPGTLPVEKPKAAPAPIKLEVQVQAVNGQAQAAVVVAQPAVQVQQVQIARPIGRPVQMPALGALTLVDGKPQDLPTHNAGALRIQAVPNQVNFGGGADAPLTIMLQVAAEPKVQLQYIVSTKIDKAVDDNGQKLTQFMPGEGQGGFQGGPVRIQGGGGAVIINRAPGGAAIAPVVPPGGGGFGGGGVGFGGGFGGWVQGTQQTYIQLKKGEKASKTIKELSGTLTVSVLDTPRDLIVVDNIVKAGGKTVKGKDGGHIKVVDVTKTDDGQYKLQVEMQAPQNMVPVNGGGIGIGFGGGFQGGGIQILPAPPPPAPPAKKEAPAEKKKDAPAEKTKGEPTEKPKEAPAKGGEAKKAEAKQAVQVQAVAQVKAAPAIARPIAFGGANGLKLVDAKGKEYQLVGVMFKAFAPGGPPTMEYTFKPATKDQGEPAKLIFSGSPAVTLEVPFTLKNVPVK